MATTYSELAEKLSKQKGKFEKLTTSTDPAERFTGERMGKSFDNKLELLFTAQESLKAEKGISPASFRQGGDPTNPFKKNPATILPELKSMWDQFQFENVNRTLAPPTYTPPTQAPVKPLPKGMFKDFFAESFGNQMVADKWNTGDYERGQLPRDSPEDIMFNAKVKNKWNLDGRERWKAPTGSFSEVFNRSMAGVRSGEIPTTITSPAGATTSVPRGTGSGASSGTGKGSATAPIARTKEVLPNLPERNPFNTGQPRGMYAMKPKGSVPAEVKSKLSAGEVVEGIAPFLDNFANLLNPTPRVPVPSLFRTPQFETRYNIEPQLQEMRRGLRTYGNQVDRSVGQGNVAAAYKAKGLADYFRGAGQAYGQKENVERGLRNTQTQAVAQVDQANTEMTNNYRMQNTARSEAERLRRIGMVNNLGEDFLTIRNDRLQRELDTDKFAILGNVFKDVIQSNPEMKKLFADQLAGGIYQKGKGKKYGGNIRMKR